MSQHDKDIVKWIPVHVWQLASALNSNVVSLKPGLVQTNEVLLDYDISPRFGSDSERDTCLAVLVWLSSVYKLSLLTEKLGLRRLALASPPGGGMRSRSCVFDCFLAWNGDGITLWHGDNRGDDLGLVLSLVTSFDDPQPDNITVGRRAVFEALIIDFIALSLLLRRPPVLRKKLPSSWSRTVFELKLLVVNNSEI